jgi:histidinol-phosphate aminotransferase
MKPHGILVIDEAYQPFATHSYLNYNDLCNLPEHVVIIRTVSKMGLAGIRFGYMVGHKHITDIINAIRPPYNLNQLTMATMNFIFDENYYATIIEQAQSLVPQRELLKQELIKYLIHRQIFY